MPVPSASVALRPPRSLSKLTAGVFALLALLLGLLAFLPWFNSVEKYLVVGLATCIGIGGTVAIGANWLALKPITYKGPVYHSERPLAYHLVSAVGFLLSLFLAFAGLSALLSWSLS